MFSSPFLYTLTLVPLLSRLPSFRLFKTSSFPLYSMVVSTAFWCNTHFPPDRRRIISYRGHRWPLSFLRNLIYSKTKEKSALCLQHNVPLVRECCYTYEGISFRQFGGCNRTLGLRQTLRRPLLLAWIQQWRKLPDISSVPSDW